MKGNDVPNKSDQRCRPITALTTAVGLG